jgi:hypothetical protein
MHFEKLGKIMPAVFPYPAMPGKAIWGFLNGYLIFAPCELHKIMSGI